MRSKAAILIVTAMASLWGEGKFNLGSILVPRPSGASGPTFIEVNTIGPPLPVGDLENGANWVVYATEANAPPIRIQPITPKWNASTANVLIEFDPALLGRRDPRLFGWEVTFTGTTPFLTASRSKLQPDAALKPAKGKDDADIYLFGSFLAGISTKPIYVIDAKLNWLVEITKGAEDPVTHKKPGTGWFWGVKSSISTNTDVKAPVDRSTVDPDSVDGSLSIDHIWRPWRRSGDDPKTSANRFLEGIDFDLRPIGGEFARKYPASDLLTKGYATLIFKPKRLAQDLWTALYPSFGYEIGKNLNQPGVLFKQPADLSGWNVIGRAVFITKGELYALQATPKEGSVYRITLDASYQPRVLLAREPFVTSEFVGGKRVSVTRLSKGTRHEVEVGVNWNIASLVGLRAQYRWGALPPLFQFVDHQVTIGVTLKAKQGKKPY